MSGLWGEIPNAPEADTGIAAVEREELTKARGLELEAPPLFQPSNRHYPPSNESLPSKAFEMDPVVLHTIRLNKHAHKIRQAIHSVQQFQAEGKMSEEAFPTLPPIPEYDGPMRKHLAEPPLNYMEPDYDSDFVRGKGEPIPNISEEVNRYLLKKSVAAILLHMSFEDSSEAVLETLTDVTHEYLRQMMDHLRNAADSAAMHGQSGFPDILEQVFHEMNVGSMSTLHDFYQTRVLDYHRTTINTCTQLSADLERLKLPLPGSSVGQAPGTSGSGNTINNNGATAPAVQQKDTFNVIRIKEEPSSSSADLQFPGLDENSQVSEAQQLLESLGNYEITVEHEAAGGLTDVDSKWSQSVKMEQDKTKSVESSDEPVNVTDTSGSVGEQDSVPQTPRTPRDLATAADGLDPGPHDPPTSVAHLPSPYLSSPPPTAGAQGGASKSKKRKTSS